MTESARIHAFEHTPPAAGAFHHRDHIRLAYAYLHCYALPEAIARFRVALQRFAAHVGMPDLYHETITLGFLFLIHERMQAGAHDDWASFEAQNPDLFAKPLVLTRYYSPERLASPLARQAFLMPDRFDEPSA